MASQPPSPPDPGDDAPEPTGTGMAEEIGDFLDLGDDEPSEGDVTDLPDGGALVDIGGSERRSKDFYENLAEKLPETQLKQIATSFLELIERDKEARKKRDEQYEEGLRRTGLGNDAPGGASFQGANKVVHPMMTEACVDFAARTMKELFPASGPVKDSIVGEPTERKIAKAKRKTALMNWQLCVQSPEFRAELEQLLTQVPLGGVQYMKLNWDETRNRPNFLFVGVDDMFIPFAATNFYSAQRRTHRQYLTKLDYETKVRSGMYRDVDLIAPGMEPDRSAAEKANDKIEGREQTSYNEDGLRTVFEIYAITDIESSEDAERDMSVMKRAPKPYIITVDDTSREVLSIYRNWDELDDTAEELQWFVEFPFIPWRGAYPIGLPQLIGGLSAAATGSLRALLDAAHISNSQTALKLKGGSRGGQNLNIQPTQVEEIEGGINVDDIRKLAMPLPFNPPSQTLFQLLGFVVEAGKGVVRTSMDNIADDSTNVPVGTTMARIEQGSMVYSSVFSRLHGAMARLLRILHRLDAMYLDNEDIEAETGEELATRADFNGPMDVVPVSDPNIFSETQRFAQVQAVAQRADLHPDLYNGHKVEERILETLRIPNAKDLLRPAVEPEQQNAINENVAASLGRPIVAFPPQDHIAHLQTHLAYMVNPMLGMNPLIAPAFSGIIVGHIKEHIALWYMQETYALASAAAGIDLNEALNEHNTDADNRALDRMLATASLAVIGQVETVFGSLPPVIEQAQKIAQQYQLPQPMDPTMVASKQVDVQAQDVAAKAQDNQQKNQIAMQREQREAARDQTDAQNDAARLQIDQQRTAQEGEADHAKLVAQAATAGAHEEHEDHRSQAEIMSRMAMNEEDNTTALDLAKLEVKTKEKFPVKTGTGINPTP